MRRFSILLAAVPAVALFARDASAAPNMTLIGQEQDQWCWAASSEMTMKAMGKTGPEISQCEQANDAKGRTDCCENPTVCNSGDWLSIQRYGFKYSTMRRGGEQDLFITIGGVGKEIDAGKPVPYIWDWNGGGAHMMVIGNVFTVFGSGFMAKYDPWPPNQGDLSWITYDEWLGGPDYDHLIRECYTGISGG